MLLISDLHFGSLLPNNVEHHLLQVALAEQDKLVLISGDITTNSKKEEFERAREFFTNLLENGVVVCVTPGNHDFGGPVAEVLHAVTHDYHRARTELDSLFLPISKQRQVLAYSAEGLDSIIQHGTTIICSLRSQHRSSTRIKKSQIKWASTILDELQGQPYRLIFMTHHSLWQDASDHHAPMAKLERIEDFLIRYKFFAFIHGHNHRFTYQNTTTPTRGFRIYRVASPTACKKNREFEQGYVLWRPPTEATLEILPSSFYPDSLKSSSLTNNKGKSTSEGVKKQSLGSKFNIFKRSLQ